MSTQADTDIIEQLVRLHELDRVRDRLQRKLDQVPIKLKAHTDTIATLESSLGDHDLTRKTSRAEADRFELELKSREEEREKIKRQMNAPSLGNREYEVLQESLAGVLADINSLSDEALQSMEKANDAEATVGELKKQLDSATNTYLEAKAELEGSLSGVKDDLAKKDVERAPLLEGVNVEALDIYERVRKKHHDAMSLMDGDHDRTAGRIGTDLHCSSCYMTVTPNDAVQILGRKKIVQCKSCVRILYA